jgi:2-hydroxychromene-2-carboxylate isomerase
MGEVIRLAERRQARRARSRKRPAPVRAEFLFDLSCPFTYLAAERVERAFDHVKWTAASAIALRRGALATEEAALAGVRAAAEERAAALRLPLVWPEQWPADVPAAMRAAAFEAAAAAGVGLDGCLRAAGDRGRDGAMETAARRLLAVGADRLPALRVGRALYWGEVQVGEAAAAARLNAAAAGRN